MLLRAITMVIATPHKGKALEGIRQSLGWCNSFRGHLELINKWNYWEHQDYLRKSIHATHCKIFKSAWPIRKRELCDHWFRAAFVTFQELLEVQRQLAVVGKIWRVASQNIWTSFPIFLLLVTSFKQTYYLLCWPTYRKRIPTFPTPHIRSLRCDCSRRTPVEARTPTQIRQALPWELAWSQGPHVGGEESTDQAPEEHTATVKIFLNKRPRLWRRLNVAFQVEHCRWGTLFISSRLALTWFRWSPKFFSAVTLLYNPVIPQIYSWEPETWHLELLKFEHDITW